METTMEMLGLHIMTSFVSSLAENGNALNVKKDTQLIQKVENVN